MGFRMIYRMSISDRNFMTKPFIVCPTVLIKIEKCQNHQKCKGLTIVHQFSDSEHLYLNAISWKIKINM